MNSIIKDVRDSLIVELTGYFKSGRLNTEKKDLINRLINAYHGNRFSCIEDVIDMHFIQRSEVKEFLKALAEMIRMYNKTSVISKERAKGALRGGINVHDTIILRSRNYIQNKSVFVINKTISYEDTEENQILYEILKIITTIENDNCIYSSIHPTNSDGYSWFEDIQEGLDDAKKVILKWKYLSIERQVSADDSSINRVCNSKRKLYSDAASLLKTYKQLKKNNITTIAEVISKTYIDATSDNVCFELYWLFKIIKENTGGYSLSNVRFNPIVHRNLCLAEWSLNNHVFKAYHNVGKTDAITFSVSINELAKGKKYKYDYAIRKAIADLKTYYQELMGKNTSEDYIFVGRPDIVIEKYEKKSKRLCDVIIGEVKYTTDPNYAKEGLRELLSYIEFCSLIDAGIGSLRESGIEPRGVVCSQVEPIKSYYNNITWRHYGDSEKFII